MDPLVLCQKLFTVQWNPLLPEMFFIKLQLMRTRKENSILNPTYYNSNLF